MSMSKVHHCIGQEMVAKGLIEPPAKRCRCREVVSNEEAQTRVNNGEARWIVIDRIRGIDDILCRLCHDDKEVKNCALCAGKGFVSVPVVVEVKSYDIVSVSAESIDEKAGIYKPELRPKTPRVPTIEWKHIIRAYVLGERAAQERIEEYGRLERERLEDLIVKVPADEYDREERENWGRASFADIRSSAKGGIGTRISAGMNVLTSDGNTYGT